MASSLPPNGVSASAQANNILREDAKKGNMAVHTFDPDATPEQKASAAGKGRDQLKSVVDSKKDTVASKGASARHTAFVTRWKATPLSNHYFLSATEVPIAGAADVMPTITIEDMDEAAMDGVETVAQPPGAMPAALAPAIPDCE